MEKPPAMKAPLLRAPIKGLTRGLTALVFRLKIEGKGNIPRKGPVIFAANHSSWIDGPLLFCSIPRLTRIMVAKEYFKPLFRPFLNTSWSIPIRRGGVDKGALGTALRTLKAGYCIGIFPEGNMSKTARLLPGRKGVAFLSLRAPAPLVPVSICGAYRAWPAWRSYPLPARVTIRIGDPIYPTPNTSATQIVKELMSRIRKGVITPERAKLDD